MKRGLSGHYITSVSSGEKVQAFVPNPLPPKPSVHFNTKLKNLMDKANLSLGRLDGVTTLLPEPSLFLYMYVRKEALLSSQIEGTQSSLADLLLYENKEIPGVPLDDVREVSNYVAAIEYGLRKLREGTPLSLRLLREIHEILLSKGRGSDKRPGEFRTSQNWIGGSRPGNAKFVPPPPHEVLACMGALEKFLHDDPVPTALLLKAALTHVQFETIHPFLDGNGRLGRLLITLLLCSEQALSQPMLYLSLYFKTNRQEYYDILQLVRKEGDWEAWLLFFLEGVQETAEQAVLTSRRLIELFEKDRERITQLGRASSSALRLHHYMNRNPIFSILRSSKNLKLTVPTITTSIQHLEKLGIVKELTGRQRNRLFVYQQYMKILSEGTKPLEN